MQQNELISAGREVKASIDAEIAKEREAALAEVQLERERILGELRGTSGGFVNLGCPKAGGRGPG